MHNVKLKLDTSVILSISSKSKRNRDNITGKLRSYFNDSNLYSVYESHHNFVIEKNGNNSACILRIVFNNDSDIIAIFLYDINEIRLKCLSIDSEDIEADSLVDWVISHDNHTVFAICPYDYILTKEALSVESNVKLCSVKTRAHTSHITNCHQCDVRTNKHISLVLNDKELLIECNGEGEDYLILMNSDLADKDINILYGYLKSEDGQYIEDIGNLPADFIDDEYDFGEISELEI